MDKRKLANRHDIIVLSIIVILTCVYVLFVMNREGSANMQAEIKMQERVIETIKLKEDRIFSIAEHPAIQFIVSDGRIAFYKSDCPDQICVRNGFLHLPGQFSVCLPNRVILTIVDPVY